MHDLKNNFIFHHLVVFQDASQNHVKSQISVQKFNQKFSPIILHHVLFELWICLKILMKFFLSSIYILVNSSCITNHITLNKIKIKITMQLAKKFYVITKLEKYPFTFTKELKINLLWNYPCKWCAPLNNVRN